MVLDLEPDCSENNSSSTGFGAHSIRQISVIDNEVEIARRAAEASQVVGNFRSMLHRMIRRLEEHYPEGIGEFLCRVSAGVTSDLVEISVHKVHHVTSKCGFDLRPFAAKVVYCRRFHRLK